MIKSLSFIIEDLFNEESNINESKSIILYNNHNDNSLKNDKIIFNKMKQMSTLSLPDEKINDINNEIISGNISNEKNNKIAEKDEKLNLKNNLKNIKKIKSPNNNYKNIYY